CPTNPANPALRNGTASPRPRTATGRLRCVRADGRERVKPTGRVADDDAMDGDSGVGCASEVHAAGHATRGLEHELHAIRDRRRSGPTIGALCHDHPLPGTVLYREPPYGIAGDDPQVILDIPGEVRQPDARGVGEQVARGCDGCTGNGAPSGSTISPVIRRDMMVFVGGRASHRRIRSAWAETTSPSCSRALASWISSWRARSSRWCAIATGCQTRTSLAIAPCVDTSVSRGMSATTGFLHTAGSTRLARRSSAGPSGTRR